jgi:hypothetical protein
VGVGSGAVFGRDDWPAEGKGEEPPAPGTGEGRALASALALASFGLVWIGATGRGGRCRSWER